MAVSLFYYPKFSNKGTEATISWDVAGYYQYLPSIFINHDLKSQEKTSAMQKKYYYSPYSDQYYTAENGNKVMKYSIGMAILYLPAFAIAHTFSLLSGFPADGYALPYQFLLTIQGLLVFFLGLFYLRKSLLTVFNDSIVAWTLLIIGLVTNALEYGAITNAMSHNYLFLGYALIIWQSIKIGDSNKTSDYIILGVTLGLMALSRPTEIIAIAIPFLYIWSKSNSDLIPFILAHLRKILITGLIIGAIGSIQLIYWKYVSDQFLQYSYQDQGFSWLRPHILDGLFSFRAGWLIYTPVMILSLIGFHQLHKVNRVWFKTTLIYSVIFIYIAFAWDIWWYGGSLGQRTMVQLYPVLAFPLAAFLNTERNKWVSVFISIFIMTSGYLNAWLIHHAHKGGLMRVGEMTKPYYLGIVGKNHVDNQVYKLLDARYIHTGQLKNPTVLLDKSEEICLDKETQSSPSFYLDPQDQKYLRIEVNFTVNDIEYEKWRWTQLIVKYLDENNESIRTDMLRIQRLNNSKGSHKEFLDSKISQSAKKAEVYLWHAESEKKLCIHNIKVIAHQ